MARRAILDQLRLPGGFARAWLGAVLALAIAVRLLVPQGWMPDGAGGLMICSGSAPAAAAMPMPHGSEHPAPAGSQVEHPCAFAALGLAAAPPPSPVLFVPHVAIAAERLPGLAVAVGHGLAAPPPPATGPPAFA